MKKIRIDALEHAGEITKALEHGVFLTTRYRDKVNSMVIGWGQIGRIWERPVFVAYVRKNRYTREILDANPEFTVNVPVNGTDPNAFRICGSESGRNQDKIQKAGLTLTDCEQISVPAIREFPLTLECRVIYRQEQELSNIPEAIRNSFYKVEKEDHICYYGEILSAYMIEE